MDSEKKYCLNAGRVATVIAFPLGGGWQLQVNGVTEEEYDFIAEKNIAEHFERTVLHPGFVTAKWRIPSTGSKGDNFPPMAEASVIFNCLGLWGFDFLNNPIPVNQQGLAHTFGLLWTLKKKFN
jgi:hypothetical protein